MTDIIKHTMKIKIKVTKEILEESKMCQDGTEVLTNCAVACAVRELFPRANVQRRHTSLLGHQTMQISMESTPDFDVIKNPKNMVDFICRFDNSLPETRASMLEEEFEIDVPDAVIDRIGLSEVHRILKDSKTLELA